MKKTDGVCTRHVYVNVAVCFIQVSLWLMSGIEGHLPVFFSPIAIMVESNNTAQCNGPKRGGHNSYAQLNSEQISGVPWSSKRPQAGQVSTLLHCSKSILKSLSDPTLKNLFSWRLGRYQKTLTQPPKEREREQKTLGQL